METDIAKLVRTFVEKLGCVCDDVECVTLSAHPLYNIHTPDSKRLIGPQGEHLRAINVLLRRMAERSFGDVDFIVDVNSYQLARIKELEQKAKMLGERVRTFHSSAELSPMNAYERMIVHALFSNDPDVMSESEGTGPMRHVVLKHRSATVS